MVRNMKKNSNTEKTAVRWTIKDVLVGKPLWVLVPALYLATMLFPSVLSRVLIPLPTGLTVLTPVFLLPSAVITLLVLQLLLNAWTATMDPEIAVRFHARGSRFQWTHLYSLIAGFVIWFVLCLVFAKVVEVATPDNSDISAVVLLLTLLMLVVPIVAAVSASRYINQFMTRFTGTNRELIEEIALGMHDKKIPKRFYNERDLCGILALLAAGRTSSVTGAVLMYAANQWSSRTSHKLGRFLFQFLFIFFSVRTISPAQLDSMVIDLTCSVVTGQVSLKDLAGQITQRLLNQ